MANAAETKPDEVGWLFVQQYYTMVRSPTKADWLFRSLLTSLVDEQNSGQASRMNLGLLAMVRL